MKVIFLDIDGVLNGNCYTPENNNAGVLIDNARLKLIKQIVDATDAKLVLSSSWKEHWEIDTDKCDETGKEMNSSFADEGLSIYDKTTTHQGNRKKEIIEWMKTHSDVKNFVVIDDSPFEEDDLKDHFVLTSQIRYGIDEDDVKKAIMILNSN